MRHLYTWCGIVMIVLASTAGDVLVSRAMKQVGEVGDLYRERGLWRTGLRVVGNPTLWLGVLFMATAFFSLMFSLSWADLSLVGPASASLTFIANAVFAKFFLHERVDTRRWVAALLVAGGVALVAA